MVFQDWDSLWSALSQYRADRSQAPKFGDWSPLLESLDSFRDGGASQRMGEYIGWLSDGLSRGLAPQDAMACAGERYASRWGADKVANLRMNGAHDGAVVDTAQVAREAVEVE